MSDRSDGRLPADEHRCCRMAGAVLLSNHRGSKASVLRRVGRCTVSEDNAVATDGRLN